MYISRHYLRMGISPSDLPSSEFSSRESSLALSESLPVDLLRDTWTWRDLYSRAPILTTLKARIQSLRLLQAQKPEISIAPYAQILLSGRTLPLVLPLKFCSPVGHPQLPCKTSP